MAKRRHLHPLPERVDIPGLWHVLRTLGWSIVASFAGLVAAHGQAAPQVTLGGGFKAPFYEGNRLVALVSGKEARPSKVAGQMEVSAFRLETFRDAPDRATELIVESLSGVSDSKGASSDRALTLRSADGRFAISGEGWSWIYASGWLVISNQVDTTLRRAHTPTNRPPVRVTARRLEYNLKTGDTRFREGCVAEEAGRARIRAGEISSRLTPQATQPEVITATNGVQIELLRPERSGRAAGMSTTYAMTAEGEQIDLSGATSWEFGAGSGSADQLTLFPARDTYSARGRARMQLRGDLAKPSPGEASKKTRTPPIPLEIACEAIDASPGEVVFSGPVLATQTNRLELRAGRVVAELNKDTDRPLDRDAVQRIAATGDVTARLLGRVDPLQLSGQQMLYALGLNPAIEVSGDPSWQTAVYTGRADRFVIHPDGPSFEAFENVEVTWMPPGGTTKSSSIQVRSSRLRGEGQEVEFGGDVVVQGTNWVLRAGEVSLEIATNTVLRGVAARGGVELDYRVSQASSTTNSGLHGAFGALLREATDEAGRWRIRAEAMHAALGPDGAGPEDLDATGGVEVEHLALRGEGGRLTYRAVDGLLRLVDDARLKTVDGLEIIGEPQTALAVDPRTRKFRVEGAVKKMSLPAHTLRRGKTNAAPPFP